jgi:hypothetical protein
MGIILRMRHVRAANMCSSGVRKFFKRHDLDWNLFLKEGIDSDIIEKINDPMGLQVIEVAKNGRK